MGLFNKAKGSDKMAKDHRDQSSQATDQDLQAGGQDEDEEYYDTRGQSGMQTAQERIGGQRSGHGQDSMLDQDEYQDDDLFQDQDPYQDPDPMQDQMRGQGRMQDQDPLDDDDQGW